MAVAGAFALHADWTCQNWFKGIGASPSGTSLPTSLDPVNGSWAAQPAGTFAGTLAWESNALVFDLEDGEHLDFTVGSTAAADTNTVTDVEVTGVFTPVTGDLPEDDTMNDRGAQVGFVVAIDGDATNYCAWVGGTGGTGVRTWVVLTNEAVDAGADVEAETTLLVRFDYRSTPKASFAIVRGTPAVTNFLGNGSGTVALPITAEVVARQENPVRAVSGVSCYGSGKLAKADGGVGLGVAEANDVKYGSLQDAIDAATAGQVVTVRRTTEESVETKNGVKISDPDGCAARATITVPENTTVGVVPTSDEINSGASGSCVVPLNFSGATVDQVVIDLGTAANYKEVRNKSVSDGKLTFDLRTKTEIITNAIPEGGKALEANPEKLHSFLAANNDGNKYTQAVVATSDIKLILDTTGSNGLKKWQSYVLDIASNDPVKPVTTPAGDKETSCITLAIPAITNSVGSGDYEIKYQVGSGALQNSPGAIQVPIENSGTYEIKINLQTK